MPPPLLEAILTRIREHGPITVAEYIEHALYHPQYGYYSTAPRRSGAGGDYITSVDAGPLFGELITAQLAECWAILRATGASRFDVVDAGASSGELSRDILDTAAREFPDLYVVLQLVLVERSTPAIEAQRSQLAAHGNRVAFARERLPHGLTGAIVANELLDALPVHRVVLRNGNLREVHLSELDGVLTPVELPPSTPRIEEFVQRIGVPLREGVFVEVGLAAVDWMAGAAAALERGFVFVFDYGSDAEALYSHLHGDGTLVAYSGHRAETRNWLAEPGLADLTAHVNLTAVREAALDAGLTKLGEVDQTYFLMSLGLADRVAGDTSVASIRRRLAARTLIAPGALGSTIKAIAFGKNVGEPQLRGFASGRRT